MLENKLKGYLNQLGFTLADQESIITGFNKLTNLEKINFLAIVENNYPSLVKDESLLNVSNEVRCINVENNKSKAVRPTKDNNPQPNEL